MQIIPAIDIKAGRCVRLYQGDFTQETVYDADPRAVAQRWVRQGAQRLHLVDLDGAKAGHPVNTDTIVSIVRSVAVPVQLGGGLRTESAARAALDLGVERVILGTAAVRQPELISRSPHGTPMPLSSALMRATVLSQPKDGRRQHIFARPTWPSKWRVSAYVALFTPTSHATAHSPSRISPQPAH